MAAPDWLAELGARLADGSGPIDWDAARGRVTTPDEAAILAQLQVLERVVSAQSGADAAADDRPLPPSPFAWGPLDVLRMLGRGSFGDVYLARDRRLDRLVALKLLRGTASSTGIIAEAQRLARLRHPNIVTVFGADAIDGRVGIWMEYVDGHTLENELRDSGPISAAAVIETATGVCAALAAAHDAGLLHRDIKTQNVIRGRDGRVVVTDFGAAGEPDGAGALAGTPAYLAPELFAGAPPSAAGDVYAFGVLLFRLLTGAFPVAATSVSAFRALHARARRPDIRGACTGAPHALVEVIQRCLAGRAADRPTAHACLQALQGLRYPTARPLRSGLALGALALAVAALATAALATGRASRALKGSPISAQHVAVSDVIDGPILAAAISSDGSRLAYATPTGIYVQNMETGVGRLVAKPTADVTDLAMVEEGGATLLFAAGGRMWKANADGDDARPLLDQVDKFAVSPDGRRLALLRQNAIWISDLSGRDLITVVRSRPDTRVAKPSWSPDGRSLAFRSDARAGTSRDLAIHTVDLVSGLDRTVFTAPSGTGIHQVLWSPDGRLLFTIPMPPPRGRYTNLFMIPVSGRSQPDTPIALTDWPDFTFISPSITSDGTRLVFVRSRWVSRIDTISLERNAEVRNRARAVRMDGEVGALDWMPDGSLLFISASRPGAVFRQPPGGRTAQEFWRAPRGAVNDATMTADGRWVLATVASANNASLLYRVDSSTGRSESLLTLPSYQAGVRCAHHEAHTCIVSVLTDSQTSFELLDPDSGTTRQLTTLALAHPEGWDLAPDGTRLAVVAADATHPHITSVSVSDGSSEDVPIGTSSASVAWLRDGHGWIVSAVRNAQSTDLLRVRPSAPTETLWRVEAERLVKPLMSADGRQLAFASWRTESQVWMLRGF